MAEQTTTATEQAPDRKTHPNDGDVDAYVAQVADDRRRADAEEVLELMRRVSGQEPRMWGTSMVGFGRQPYRTSDGKERETFAIGFSPRKTALTLYGLTYYGTNTDLLERLGPHTTGKSCVYVKRLDDVDRDVLEQIVRRSWEENHDQPC